MLPLKEFLSGVREEQKVNLGTCKHSVSDAQITCLKLVMLSEQYL